MPRARPRHDHDAGGPAELLHDVALDLIVTPERVIEIPRWKRRPPAGVRWDELTDDKIAAIPLLADLRGRRGRR